MGNNKMHSINGQSSIRNTSSKANFVDLFAGCGGLSLGLENVGFKPLLVSELNEDARKTYMANRSIYKKELVEVGCIYDLQTSYLKKLKKVWGEVDLVVGGPPCQGFSGIGHRRTYSIDKKKIYLQIIFMKR